MAAMAMAAPGSARNSFSRISHMTKCDTLIGLFNHDRAVFHALRLFPATWEFTRT